jgi:methyltransferase (TIGR00027 family)
VAAARGAADGGTVVIDIPPRGELELPAGVPGAKSRDLRAATMTDVELTAFLTAALRAIESERPDALFLDEHAARLSGERGRALVEALERGREAAGALAVRTHVFDRRIRVAVTAEGVDTVLDLGAGLDTRPYRLPLPASLRWVDVELPGILAHRAEVLAGAQPRCHHEAVGLDLADGDARRALLRRIGRAAKRVLVVTEGLLVHLAPPDVAALADDLRAERCFDRWLTDLASPLLVAELRRLWGDALGPGGATVFRFGPAEGARFFRRHGFRVAERRSLWDDVRRFGRAAPSSLRERVDSGEAPRELAAAVKAMGSILLLERARPA